MARGIPHDANALWRWMHERRVTIDELARRLRVSAVYLGNVRRGNARPSDALKTRIAEVTRAMDGEFGIAEPLGVTVDTWYKPEHLGGKGALS